MNDGYLWWLILVGAVITLAVVWVVAARLPRSEADVGADERRAEAAWISETIERFGGVAPAELVEEVLELHAEYLASPGLARTPDRAEEEVVASEVAVPLAPAPMPPGTVPPDPLAAMPPSTLAPRTVSGPPLPPGAPPPPLRSADRPPPRPR